MQTAQKWKNVKKGYDGFWDSRYPAGDKPSGTDVAQYSGAVLSGGTLIMGPYCAENETSAPADSNFFPFGGGTNTVTFANGGFEINYKAGDNSNAGATIRVGNVGSYREVYIDYYLEIDNTLGEGVGNKQLKWGGTNDIGYANMTFGMFYNGGVNMGKILEMSYSDGTGITNDTNQYVSTDEANHPSVDGRNAGYIQKSTPHGPWLPSEWNPNSPAITRHHIRAMARLNSGDTAENEVRDGAAYLEIDGQVIYDIGSFFNSNYQNTKVIHDIKIGDVAQNSANDWSARYIDMKVSIGGFL